MTRDRPERPTFVVIEDNALIALEIEDVLVASGFESVGAFARYDEALKRIDQASPDFCVLDLDLGGQQIDGTVPGDEGRRILTVLHSRGIPTVVYSGHARVQQQLGELHSRVLVVDKSSPTIRVAEAMRQLSRAP